MQTEHKNKLIEYQGGGYDGCFWEWNYCFFDSNGEFHDVFSSGSMGISTVEQWRRREQSVIDGICSPCCIYDLTSPKALKELATETNAVHLMGLVKWFAEHTDLEVYAVCSICDEHLADYEDISLEDWHGCGGIMSTADTIVCNQCRAFWTCEVCNEYVGEGGLAAITDEQILDRINETDCIHACDGCIKEAEEAVEQREQQDMLWSCFIAGKPDLFGPKMNWYWGLA